eukprot:scaffold42962_cov191-Amphora_coffeaeformis.AAC.1
MKESQKQMAFQLRQIEQIEKDRKALDQEEDEMNNRFRDEDEEDISQLAIHLMLEEKNPGDPFVFAQLEDDTSSYPIAEKGKVIRFADVVNYFSPPSNAGKGNDDDANYSTPPSNNTKGEDDDANYSTTPSNHSTPLTKTAKAQDDANYSTPPTKTTKAKDDANYFTPPSNTAKEKDDANYSTPPPSTAKKQPPPTPRVIPNLSDQFDGVDPFEDDDVLRLVNCLGDGSFGRVYHVQDVVDEQHYAVKVVPNRSSSLLELKSLALLSNHEHIVSYRNYWRDDKFLFIKMELYQGLAEGGKQQSPKELLRHMLSALGFIHGKGWCHLDVKPDNIVFSIMDNGERKYKLGDFGHARVSKLKPDPMDSKDIEDGDQRYIAKELLDNNHKDLSKADIFSLGLTIYSLSLKTKLPQDGPEWHALRNGFAPGRLPLKEFHDIVVLSMMHPEYQKRGSAMGLLKQLDESAEKSHQAENQPTLANLASSSDEPQPNGLQIGARGLFNGCAYVVTHIHDGKCHVDIRITDNHRTKVMKKVSLYVLNFPKGTKVKYHGTRFVVSKQTNMKVEISNGDTTRKAMPTSLEFDVDH